MLVFMIRFFEIPFLIVLATAILQFSKDASNSYVVAATRELGVDAWIGAFTVFAIRFTVVLGSAIMKRYKLGPHRTLSIMGILSFIWGVGYLVISLSNSLPVLFLGCFIVGIGYTSTILGQAAIATSVADATRHAGCTHSTFVFTDSSKRVLALIFSGLLALFIALYDMLTALYVLTAVHMILGVYLFFTHHFEALPIERTKSKSDKRKKYKGTPGINRSIPNSAFIMVVNCWASVVPAIKIVHDYPSYNASAMVGYLAASLMAGYLCGSALAMLFKNRLDSMRMVSVLASGVFAAATVFAPNPWALIVLSGLLSAAIGLFFVLNLSVINSEPGDNAQKNSYYHFVINFWQPWVYLLIPFLVKYGILDYLLIVAVFLWAAQHLANRWRIT